MVAWQMNDELERFGRKRSWRNGTTIPTQVKGLRTVLRSEIRAEYLYDTWFNINKLRITLNAVLILIRRCATQSKFAKFRCFFLLLYLTCFGLPGQHQVHKMCVRSPLCFPFEVLDASRCFVQVVLHHTYNIRGNESNIFDKQKPNTWLDTKAWRNITWTKHLDQCFSTVGPWHQLHRALVL
jgi:hypothetical protein